MTQTEQVIYAMREAGGSATFEQLNKLLNFSQWKTKTPEATVRRIVQESATFFKVRPGLWALREYRDKILNTVDRAIEENQDQAAIPTSNHNLHNEEHEALDTNRKLSYCAYFLSKYDMQAVEFLGFNTRDEAMNIMSKILGKENNYLKRRRDEFDVLTSSHRKGQWNRPSVRDVLRMHHELSNLPFKELPIQCSKY